MLAANLNLTLGDVGSKLLSFFKIEPGIFLGLIGGLVVVGLLLLAYRAFLKVRDKAQGTPFLEKIKGAMARTPTAVAEPAQRARLDDLRKKYEEGVEKFRQAGKDLYSLPWYLLVGPAGSGKTEAMRHCKVGFPPGLQDCFQGAGGTMNMHWWFTNHAVVLDTAGRMFMDESALQGGSEWREFLKMLKQSRPNAPMNGMLLVIGVDSLIKDTAEQIENKAGHIAKQLDTIQRTLDVRFPVYVVITKCDLITGFKEFFDKIDDPQLQHQILGWSNPAPLDEAFRAEAVDEHLKTIRSRLLRRRATLLMDPVHTEDPQARRTDQVDELYALPDNMAKIGPRLRRYLEIIFQAGEWSPKPLFLRGIYFTSSMRQGKALDEDLAAALGVSVDSIPGGNVYDEERSFFLRDVFTAKIFREKGLVTRATNVQREQAGRKRLILASGVAVAAALIGMTFFSSAQLRQAVRDPLTTWSNVATGLDQAAVIRVSASGADAYFGNEERIEVEGGEKITPLKIIQRAKAQSESPVSMGFLSFGSVLGDINEKQREAYKAVVARAIGKPLFDRTRAQLTDRGVPWSPRATAALGELVAADIRAREGVPAFEADTKNPPDPKKGFPSAMVAFLLPASENPGEPSLASSIPAQDIEQLREALKAIPPSQYAAYGLAGGDGSLGDIKKAIDRARDSWEKSVTITGDLGELARANDAVTAFGASAASLRQIADQKPATLEQYNTLAGAYAKGVADLEKNAADVKLAEKAASWARLGDKPDQELAADAKRAIQKQAEIVSAGLPADVKAEIDKKSKVAPAAEAIKAMLETAVDDATKDILSKVASVKAGLKDENKLALLGRGRTNDEYGFQAAIHLLKGATAVLVPAEAPAAEWLKASDRIKEINDAEASARKAIADWEAAAPARLKSANFGSLASKAVETGRGGRVGAWVGSLASGLDGGGKSLREVVSSNAGAPPARRKVAMSSLDGKQQVDAGFSPSVAGGVFRGWRAIRVETGPGRPWILIEPATAELIGRLSPRVTAYGREYADLWLGQVQASNVREYPSWAAFHKDLVELDPPDVTEVHAAVKELLDQVRGDLLAIAEGLDAKEYKRQADELDAQFAVIGRLNAEVIAGKIDSARTRLRLLGADVGKARGTLLDMLSPGSTDLEAFTGVYSDEIVPRYWRSLVQSGLTALSKEYQEQAKGDLDTLRGLARFPLVRDLNTTPLTTAELAKAAEVLRRLQASSNERAFQLPARAENLREPLAGLVKAAVLRSKPNLADFVQKSLRITEYLAGEDGASLLVSIGRVNETRKPSANGEYEAIRWVADQWIWKGVMGQGESTDAAESEPIRAPRAGEQPVSLVFINKAQGGVEVATAEFPAPWAGPRLVLTPGSEPDRPGAVETKGPASVWFVPVTVPVEADVQGSKRMINRYMWIRVTLKRGLPVGNEWPSLGDLER